MVVMVIAGVPAIQDTRVRDYRRCFRILRHPERMVSRSQLIDIHR
jgi:hypothetical protein